MSTRTKKLLELSKNYYPDISTVSANSSVGSVASLNRSSDYSGPGYVETLSPQVFESSGSEYIPSSYETSANSFSTVNSSVEVEIENDLLADMVNVYNDHVIKHKKLKASQSTKKRGSSNVEQLLSHTACKSRPEACQNKIANNEFENPQSKSIDNESNKETEEIRQENNQDILNQNCMISDSEDERETGNKENQILVSAAQTSNGKRVRNKGHICYFCNKQIINMARHITTMHAEETEVAKILSYPKSSKARKQLFEKLTKAGDFYYNCNVIELKAGELILVRRPGKNQRMQYTDYGPCPQCLGFFVKKRLSLHYKTCKPNSKHDAKVITQSNALMACTQQKFHSSFIRDIKDAFRDDDIGLICKNDDLILRYGYMNYEKFGSSQNELIRQYMRQLGRLLKEARTHDRSITNFDSLLKTQKFDVVIDSVKSLCRTFDEFNARPEFGVPSLALKIGHGIRKCVGIARGTCLRNGSIIRDKELTNFLALLDLEWSIRISSAALSTLSKRKFNVAQLLPLTEDLVKLGNYIDAEMTNQQLHIQNGSNIKASWNLLAKLALSRIILFNKRRSGESAKITIENYNSRPAWGDQNTEELKNSLSDVERKLASCLTLVEIRGKCGRKVPVLLTSAMKCAIDLLIKCRSEAGIISENKYIFARGSGSLNHLRGHDCLNQIMENVVLARPELISGTKLRKYVATVAQVFNLSENEYDWLARHLGHDIRVHREFYRLHESAVELTKVSRILIAVDAGKVAQFAGREISDINIEDLPHVEEDDLEVENVQDEGGSDVELEPSADVEGQMSVKNKPTSTPSLVKVTKKRTAVKSNWGAEEKEGVFNFFKTHIKKGVVPKKQECEECMEKCPMLKKRKWSDLKFCVKNQITKIKNKVK